MYPLQIPTPFEVTPGFGTRFIVNRLFYHQYESPYSSCTVRENKQIGNKNNYINNKIDGVSLFEKMVSTNYSYTQANCIKLCRQLLIAQTCGCSTLKVDWKVLGLDYCLNDSQVACAEEFNVLVKNSEKIRTNCLPQCPLECDINTFETSVYNYKYPPSKSYVNDTYKKLNNIFILQSDFTENLAINMVQFSIYYDSLAYSLVEEEPKMSTDVLVGAVGGHLDLFMGMSMLGFVEIVELFVVFLVKSVSCRKPKVCDRKDSGVEI